MDMRDSLKSMLNNIINDNPEQATLDLHGYLTSKMRQVSGLASGANTAPEVNTPEDTSSDPE